MAESEAESKVEVSENVSKNDTNDREIEEEQPDEPRQRDWQSCRGTIRERNRFMFNNALMSDVHFLVGMEQEGEDGASNRCQRSIPAHKYVMAISSPVFYAMFYGNMAEVRDAIVIPDSTYECFVEFLRFLYYDEANLTFDCVLGVRYLAKKYIVPSLEKKCANFVEEAVDAGNVFKLLSRSRDYKDEVVERVCWDFLDSETVEALKSPSFPRVDKEVVRELLVRDTLHAKEIELFLALQKWTIGQNPEQENEEETSKIDSSSELVNLVRYPLMSQREFAEHVAKSKLLRHEDVINMFLKFNDTLEDDTVIPFSQVPRRGYYRCSLYDEVYYNWDSDTWDVESSKMPNVLSFSSNSTILLCGVGLYGNDNKDDSYSFHVDVYDEDNQLLLSSEGSFSCHAQCFAYDVIFNKPVKVHNNIWYSIQASVDGPRGVCGGQSVATPHVELDIGEITCEPVKFLFKDLNGSQARLHNMYNHFAGLLYFLH